MQAQIMPTIILTILKEYPQLLVLRSQRGFFQLLTGKMISGARRSRQGKSARRGEWGEIGTPGSITNTG